MKSFIAIILFAGIAHAAPKATSTNTAAIAPAATPAAASNTATMANNSETKAYLSTNFLGMANGAGNINIDLMLNNKVALNLGMSSFSKKEKMKTTDTAESVVDRGVSNIGATFFLNGANSETTIILNPALAFGTKKNALHVENQTGLNVRLTASKKMNSDIRMEVGVSGNNLENSEFKGDIYAGVGYLF